MLDPVSVEPADLLPFEIEAFGHAGRNYRLRAPEAGEAAPAKAEAEAEGVLEVAAEAVPAAPAEAEAEGAGEAEAEAAEAAGATEAAAKRFGGVPRHNWLYFPSMRADNELLLLFAYDSVLAQPGGFSFSTSPGADGAYSGAAQREAPFGHMPVATVVHSAFPDPAAGPATAGENERLVSFRMLFVSFVGAAGERESIDTRLLLVWD